MRPFDMLQASLIALSLLAVSPWASRAAAQTAYYEATTIDFETNCDGTPIPDADFAGGTPDRLDLGDTPQRFTSCGIASITSPNDGNPGFTAPQLYRPSLGGLLDSISGIHGATALVGSSTVSNLRDLTITFTTPVNELAFRVLDLDNASGLTITLKDASNNVIATPAFTVSSGTVTFDHEFSTGVKTVTLSYVENTIIDDWAVDDLSFNTWHCGDPEVESQAGEDCDDQNGVQCDTCGNDCKTTIDGCLDGATCVADGTVQSGSGGCAVCDVSKRIAGSDVGYTNAALDTACDSDGLTCTDDLCSASGACEHRVQSGFCNVGGTCYADGAKQPGNDCNACDSTSSKTAFTGVAPGTACNDGEALTCTDDVCDGNGTCEHLVKNGTCAVAGVCYVDGDEQPGNVCNECASATSKTAFTPATLGKSCSDGKFCTDADQCNGSGSCVGTTLDCSDTAPCTVDTCDEVNDTCVNTIAVGCLISGACVANGEKNPVNACELCDRDASLTAWTERAAGEQCGDPSCLGGVLTPAPLCDASGTCEAQPMETCDGAVCANEESCTGTCQTDADCLEQNHCDAGKCVPDDPNGKPCERDTQCASGFCADGVCCNAACDRVCESCDAAGSVGMCKGAAVGTDPEKDCPDAQICASPGLCVPEDRPNGTACDRDAVCKSRHCVDGVCCDTGCDGTCEACNVSTKEGTCTPFDVGTDPANECSGEAVCNGTSACVGYETRGNGFCTLTPGRTRTASAWWLGGLIALGIAIARRRRRR